MGCRGGYTATCCSVINFKEGTIVADIDDSYYMVGIDWIVMKGPDVGRESREWIATYGKEGRERALRLAHLLITTPEVVGPGEREALDVWVYDHEGDVVYSWWEERKPWCTRSILLGDSGGMQGA